MNRIDATFKKLKKDGKKALIIYITGGYPSLGATAALALEFEKCGADIIEIGIPFSDPIADGPTIQKASEEALKRNVTLDKILKIVKKIRQKSEIPIIFMSYFNPILAYGINRFIADSLKNGVDGVIIPDLPYEEAGYLEKMIGSRKFNLIFLTSPTTTKERLKVISGKTKSFIYHVSLTGVTGERTQVPKNIKENVRIIKNFNKKPVCVGFGISNVKQAKEVARISDGVIVGSAIINSIKKSKNIKITGRFVRELARAVHKV